MTDANARDNRFLLHNSYYSLPLGPSCHTIFLCSPALPSLVPPFTKITYIFIFFCLTNNVHDIFSLLFICSFSCRLLKAKNSFSLSPFFHAQCFVLRTTIENNSLRRRCAQVYIFIYIIYICLFIFICMYIYLFIILLLSLCILVPCPRG